MADLDLQAAGRVPAERAGRAGAGLPDAAAETPVHVRLVNVTKRFGRGAPAVDDISLSIPRGSFTTLLGPSGCGKTTTLRMIAGFYEPDAGDIYLGDRRINDVPAHRRHTAMVFQDYALFPHMSVAENVAYGLKLAHVPRPELARRVAETLRFLGLTGLENRSPNQLSGGQQQRVALARALVMSPEALLLDEPLSNLDAKLRVSIRDELTSIQRELGLTTIYVTHDQEEALAMSDRIAVMNRGRVEQWGTPWEIYYRPRTPFLADFVGSVNLVPVPVLAAEGDRLRVRLGEAEVALTPPPPSLKGRGGGGEDGSLPNDAAALVRDGTALLAIRPETLRLAPTGAEPGSAGTVAVRGEVVRRSFVGHLMRYTVRAGDREWLVDEPDPAARPLLDGPVTVVVNPARIHVIPERDA